jgi:hypothetical protein
MVKQVIVLGLAAWTAVALAAPLRETGVAADAKWIVHGDAAGFRQTEVGKYLLNELSNPTNEALFAAFKSVWNSDPRTDLDSYTLYGATAAPADAVVILRGRHDMTRSTAVFKTNSTYRLFTEGRFSIHHWMEVSSVPTWLCGFDDRTVVITRKHELMRQALAVLEGKAPSLQAPEAIGGATNYLVAFANLKAIGGEAAQSIALQHAESVNFTYTERQDQVVLTSTLRATESKTAGKLTAVLQGALATLELNSEAKPDSADREALLRFIRNISVRQQQERVTVTAILPVTDFIALTKSRALQQWLGMR